MSMRDAPQYADGHRYKSGNHYISVLEAGCQELEALIILLAIQHNSAQRTEDPKQKVITSASADAISQLACIKAYSLFFDEGKHAASLHNFLGKKPTQSGSDDLIMRAAEIIYLTPDEDNLRVFHARKLGMDEVRGAKEFSEINAEHTRWIATRHAKILRVFARLQTRAAELDLENNRNLWLAHTSLKAGKTKYAHQNSPITFHFLTRCRALLRSVIETFKPAEFYRDGRATWQDVIELTKPPSTQPATAS
jgi:hypothetical protein